MNADFLARFGPARSSGVITIFVVSGLALYLMMSWSQYTVQGFLLASFLMFLNLVLFIENSTGWGKGSLSAYKQLVILQLFIVFAVFFVVPYSFTAILLGIWCGNLVYLFTLRTAVFILPVLSLCYHSIFTFYWEFDNFITSTLLYMMLNLFTMVMVDSVRKESMANEESRQLNRELLAAQSLLREATKQSERVRIARDIHDLVGHHLTALTINLQVAMHKSEGDAKQQVEKSFAIAKLLLSDVREAVTEIREKSNIELRESLEALVLSVPRLKIELELQDDLHLTNVEVADAIIKCVQESITNSLKHGDGNRFKVRLFEERENLVLDMQDNGSVQPKLSFGNGLTGIKERIQQLSGDVQFFPDNAGFRTLIHIPQS